MTTPQLDRLSAQCQRLRLHRVDAELTTLLEQAAETFDWKFQPSIEPR